MSSEFRPSTPADADAITALCQRALSVPEGSPMFSPPHLRWKYWEPWAAWAGSRSYVLTREDRIVAHAAVLPLGFRGHARSFTLLHLLDWASEPAAVGSSVSVLKRISALADGLLIVGGSATTQRMVGPLGFRRLGEVRRYSRSLKDVPALDVAAPLGEYQLFPLRADTPPIPDVPTGTDVFWSHRSPAALLDLMRCPAAKIQGHVVVKHGRAVGGFVLVFVPFQNRIAALWSASDSVDDWTSMLRLAERETRAQSACDETVCMTTSHAQAEALEARGFVARGGVPMFVLAPRESMPDDARLAFQMIDGDVAFLHHATPQPWA